MIYRLLIAVLLAALAGSASAMQAPLSQASKQKVELLAQVAQAVTNGSSELNKYIEKRQAQNMIKNAGDFEASEDVAQLTALINQIPAENQTLKTTLLSLLQKVVKYDQATNDALLASLIKDFDHAHKLAISATEAAIKAASQPQPASASTASNFFQQVDQLILEKQARRITDYNKFSLDTRIALIHYIWPMLNPNNLQPAITLSTRLNIKPRDTWEYLQKIKEELIQSVLEGQLDTLIQAKQNKTSINYSQYLPQNLQDLKEKVDTLLIQLNKSPLIGIADRLRIPEYKLMDYLKAIREDLGKAISRLETPVKTTPKISIQSIIEFGNQVTAELKDRYINYISLRLANNRIKFEKISDKYGTTNALKVYIDPSDGPFLQEIIDEAMGSVTDLP